MIQNRITQLFAKKSQNLLNVYFTAGFPELEDTEAIIYELAQAGADIIEIGIPFSDPIADGPTIQDSNQIALNNGITLERIFEQLSKIREKTNIPILLMGYINPVLQFGIERFCEMAGKIGIDGMILPDLPLQEYLDEYRELFEKNNLSNIFLITPQTSDARIRLIDQYSQGFIYAVSTDSTTGKTTGFAEPQLAYFQRVRDMKLKNPFLIGFGISDHKSFTQATTYANGAIIGSAFIKALKTGGKSAGNIQNFVTNIRTLTN